MIYNKSSLENVSSPEKTDEYIRTVKPGPRLTAVAIIFAVLAGAAWLFLCI